MEASRAVPLWTRVGFFLLFLEQLSEARHETQLYKVRGRTSTVVCMYDIWTIIQISKAPH